jgi:4-amino-4-deoxy-L-arabinose transferase-like glycosyltransferase
VSKRGRRQNRETRPRPRAASGAPWPALALAGLAGYLVWFLLVPVSVGPGSGTFRRGAILAQVLLPDDLVRSWLGTPPEFALLDRLPVLALAAAMLAAAGAGGWLVLVALRVDRRLTRAERVCLAVGLGLSLTSLYALGVGLAGALQSPLAFAAPLVAVVLGAAGLMWRRWRTRASDHAETTPLPEGQGAERRPSADRHDTPSRWQRWLPWLALPFCAALVLGGMLPPADFDVREYHLQAPKEFFQNGRIGFLPHNVYANMPLGAEVLALPAMALWGDWWHGALVGKTLMALFAPLAALAVYCAGRRLFSAEAGVAAALVYLGTPWIADVSTTGMIEGAVGCYLALALLAGVIGRQGGDALRDLRGEERKVDDAPRAIWPWFALAGFFAGSSVACKYPAVLFVLLPLGAWVGWTAAGQRRRSLAVFALAAALACGPWLAKNAVLTGNPTYPLLYSFFGGQTRTAEKDAQWRAAHRPRGYAPGVPAYSFDDAARRLADLAGRSPWHSPVVVPLAALGLAAARWRRTTAVLATYLAFVVLAWWLLTHRIDRFWVPALPVAALLAGAGLCWSADAWWRRGAWCLVGVGLFYAWLAAVGVVGADHRYFVRLARLRVDRARGGHGRVDEAHLYLNAQATPGQSVLLVGDAAPFDLELPAYYNTVFDDDWFVALCKDRAPAEVRRELADRGIAWVYVHWAEIARYRSEGNYGYPDFVQRDVLARLVDQGVLRAHLRGPWQDHGDIFPVAGVNPP